MQIKNPGIAQQPKIDRSASIGPAQVAAKQVPRLEVNAQLAAPDLDKAVAKGTAQEFAKAATAPKTGKAPIHVRLESQQSMNQDAHRALDKSQGKLAKAEATFTKGLEGEDKADFKQEQKAFANFMEAEATFQANLDARGGTLAPLIWAGTAKQLVDQRNHVMADRAKQGSASYHGSSTVNDAPQQVMNQAAWEAFGKTDAKLTKLTDKIASTLEGDDLKEFKAACQAFGDYREALSSFEANKEARGGTLAPLIKAGVAEGMTAERIAQLAEVAKQH